MPTTASIRINGEPAGVAQTDLPLNGTVFLSNDTAASTYEWVILSQPAGAQDDLDPPYPLNPIVSYDPAPKFVSTKEGSYLIRLTVNKGLADEATDTTICAVKELLTGDRIPAPQETTEVSEEYGWATAAVTKILQRVTRLSDAGIFVAQNASGGNLSLGKVVHMNGMTAIGNGDNERPIPTVDLAFGDVLDTVDGPLGVMVGNRDGDPLAVAVGELCRVMVMGGIAGYTSLGIGGAQGDPVFVGNDGSLSLTAGFFIRQVGDIANVITDGVYDIAISAGANSIPRGNAGNDLSGSYPDPTVARINGTSVGDSTGAAVGNVLRVTDILTPEAEWGPVDLANGNAVTGILPAANGGTGQNMTPNAGGIVYGTTGNKLDITGPGTAGYLLASGGAGAPSWTQYVPLANGGTSTTLAAAATNSVIYKAATALAATAAPSAVGQVLRHTASGPAFGAVDLADTDAVIGTLAVNRGGTGQASALSPGGIILAQSTAAMISLAPPVTSGSVLLGGPGAGPSWSAKLPLASGGTNADLSAETTNGIIIKSTASTLGAIAPATGGGVLLTSTSLGVPTWKAAGNTGEILTLTSPIPGIYSLDWQDFGTYFNQQYASSTITPADASYSTSSVTFSIVRSLSVTLKPGIAAISVVPPPDGAQLSTAITILNNGTFATVVIRYIVEFPDSTSDTYTYYFNTPEAHKNNQAGGSFTFPSLSFLTTQSGVHVVRIEAATLGGNTLTINNISLRVTQG